MAQETAAQLEAAGFSVALINPRYKPLDGATIEGLRPQVPRPLYLHYADIHTPVERIGWPDQFIEHGKVSILREKHGLRRRGHAEDDSPPPFPEEIRAKGVA